MKIVLALSALVLAQMTTQSALAATPAQATWRLYQATQSAAKNLAADGIPSQFTESLTSVIVRMDRLVEVEKGVSVFLVHLPNGVRIEGLNTHLLSRAQNSSLHSSLRADRLVEERIANQNLPFVRLDVLVPSKIIGDKKIDVARHREIMAEIDLQITATVGTRKVNGVQTVWSNLADSGGLIIRDTADAGEAQLAMRTLAQLLSRLQ